MTSKYGLDTTQTISSSRKTPKNKHVKYNMSHPYFPPEQIPHILEKFKKILQGNDNLSQGKYTLEFEKEFAKYSHCNYGVGTNSCSAALEIALRTLNLQPDDEVIVPVETFIATGAAIIREGGKPIFAGIGSDTFCLTLAETKRLHSKKTKAVIIVHMAGLITPEIKAIKSYCTQNNLFLIEDAAHAPGAELDGQRAGSFGDCGCFSFYSTKIITTGEGGMLVTNNPDLYKKFNALRHRGRDLDFTGERYSLLGTNNRMTEITAILGLSQLSCIDELIKKRNQVADLYKSLLVEGEKYGWITILPKPQNGRHSYWRFIVKLHKRFNREILRNKLQKYHIPIDWAYDPLLHLQPLFKSRSHTSESDLFATEEIMKHFFCLPIHPLLITEDIHFIADKLLQYLSKMSKV